MLTVVTVVSLAGMVVGLFDEIRVVAAAGAFAGEFRVGRRGGGPAGLIIRMAGKLVVRLIRMMMVVAVTVGVRSETLRTARLRLGLRLRLRLGLRLVVVVEQIHMVQGVVRARRGLVLVDVEPFGGGRRRRGWLAGRGNRQRR
jgi:hypothetical protein